MRTRPLPLLIAGALVALVASASASASAGEGPPAPAALAGASTQLVSVDVDGQQFDSSWSDNAAVSASGRYVAFERGYSEGVYVRDRASRTTEPISTGFSGQARDPDISANGNLVVFSSSARGELYLYDRSTDILTSLFPATGCDCWSPAISASGAVIAFESYEDDVVPGDTNGSLDVFVRDRAAGTTERISVSSSEVQGNSGGRSAAVSGNGRYVAFSSSSTNLVRGDTNGQDDIFVRDRVAGTTKRVSVDSTGAQGNASAAYPDISRNGQFIAFTSFASNWPGSTGVPKVYVRDRSAVTTEMVSVSSAGVVANGVGLDPAISDNGRFVTFSSSATNLVPGDTSNGGDVYLRDRTAGTTSLISVSTAGVKGNNISERPAISGSAAAPIVAFSSRATNLVPSDSNAIPDIFARKTG